MLILEGGKAGIISDIRREPTRVLAIFPPGSDGKEIMCVRVARVCVIIKQEEKCNLTSATLASSTLVTFPQPFVQSKRPGKGQRQLGLKDGKLRRQGGVTASMGRWADDSFYATHLCHSPSILLIDNQPASPTVGVLTVDAIMQLLFHVKSTLLYSRSMLPLYHADLDPAFPHARAPVCGVPRNSHDGRGGRNLDQRIVCELPP